MLLRPGTPSTPPVYTIRTPEIRDRVLQAIEDGCSRRVAASAAGINRDSLRKWIDEDPEMALAVEQAESVVVRRHLKLIERAAKADTRNWTASAWILERTWPEEYGRREVRQHEVSGRVEFDVKQALQDPETIKMMAELEARVAMPIIDGEAEEVPDVGAG